MKQKKYCEDQIKLSKKSEKENYKSKYVEKRLLESFI